MRKTLLLMMVFCILACLMLVSCGDDEQESPVTSTSKVENKTDDSLKASEGLEFALNSDGKSYDLVGLGECKDSVLVIPETYNGLPVVSVGATKYVVFNSTEITKVVLNESIMNIQNGTFYSCPNLQYNKYGDGYYLGSEKNPYMALMKVDNKEIESFEIHKDTEVIGDGALSYCYKLRSIELPKGLRSICDGAFNACEALTSIDIPDTVTYIGGTAFNMCGGLTDVKMSKNVTYIGKYAFANCKLISKIEIPSCLEKMDDLVFDNCPSLVYNVYDNGKYLGNEENPYVVLVSITSAATSCEINENTRIIAGSAFFERKTIESITIPNGVKAIGALAFYGCTNLKTVTISDSVVEIGNQAFSGCKRLENVTIGCGVEYIGFYVFVNCSALKTIVIPKSVAIIGDGILSEGSECTIYCEIENKPSGWKENWHNNNSVVWGYKAL